MPKAAATRRTSGMRDCFTIESALGNMRNHTNPAPLWATMMKHRVHKEHSSGAEAPDDVLVCFDDLQLSWCGYRDMVYEVLFEGINPMPSETARKHIFFNHPFLSPATFLSFSAPDSPYVPAVKLYAFVAKRFLLFRLLCELRFTPVSAPTALTTVLSERHSTRSSSLRESDVEQFIKSIIPNLKLVRDLPPWMTPYYLCHATRHLMFMCDPLRRGHISCEDCVRSESFADLLRLYESDADQAVCGFSIGSIVDIPAVSHATASPGVVFTEEDTVAAEVVRIDSDCAEAALTDMYTVRVLNASALVSDSDDGGASQLVTLPRSQIYWNPECGVTDVDSATPGRVNWFSISFCNRIYEQFTDLDEDGDGVLSLEELGRYGDCTYTPLAIQRVFDCHVPLSPSGRHIMDYRTFLDFVVATEYASSRAGSKYIWKLLDLSGAGHCVSIPTLRVFCKEIADCLVVDGLMDYISPESVLSEIVDMINPRWHEYVTFDDIVESGQQSIVLPILLSHKFFFSYDCREQYAASSDDAYSEEALA